MFAVDDILHPFLASVSEHYPEAVSMIRSRIEAGDDVDSTGGEDAIDYGADAYSPLDQIRIAEELIDQLIVHPAFAACSMPAQLDALELAGRTVLLRTARQTYHVRTEEGALAAAVEFQKSCKTYLALLRSRLDPDPGPGHDDGGPDNDGGPWDPEPSGGTGADPVEQSADIEGDQPDWGADTNESDDVVVVPVIGRMR